MGNKLKFVLSDLHIGVAADDVNQQTNQTLRHFLDAIAAESDQRQSEVELIINGDFFDFLHVPAADHFDPEQSYPREAYLDSSEAASIARLELIISHNQPVFEALSDFMHTGVPKRRITIIKGVNDVHFYWPRVKACLREALGASGTRASLLLFAAEFVSREKIYVEHGHQRVGKLYRYPDFQDPRQQHDPTQLYYPTSSLFAIDMARQRRLAANAIIPTTALAWYILHQDLDLDVSMLDNFMRPAFTTNGTAKQLWPDLLDEQTPLSQNRDMRRQLHQELRTYLGENVDSTRGEDPLAFVRAEQTQHRARLEQAAEEVAQLEGARVVLFGHSHHPMTAPLSNGSTYINTGCWLPEMDIIEAEGGSLQLQQLPRRMPYARIEYDEADMPSAHLLDFVGSASHSSNGSKSHNNLLGWMAKLFRA